MQRILNVNPLNQVATWEQVKAKRNELEVSPIMVPKGIFDADRDSIMRINTAITAFDALPNLTVNNELGWKTYDNTVVLMTKTDLVGLQEAVAQRASLIFYYAEQIFANSTLVKDLDNLNLWGL